MMAPCNLEKSGSKCCASPSSAALLDDPTETGVKEHH